MYNKINNNIGFNVRAGLWPTPPHQKHLGAKHIPSSSHMGKMASHQHNEMATNVRQALATKCNRAIEFGLEPTAYFTADRNSDGIAEIGMVFSQNAANQFSDNFACYFDPVTHTLSE